MDRVYNVRFDAESHVCSPAAGAFSLARDLNGKIGGPRRKRRKKRQTT